MSRAAELENSGWISPWWVVVVSGSSDATAPAPDTASDEELVRAAQDGSRDAFDLLVVRHRRGIYHLCARYARSHEDAADLAQDVFLRAFRALGQFKRQASFKTWLYRIAVNACLNHVTAKGPRLDRMESLDDLEIAGVGGEDAAGTLVRKERARQVRAAIAQLPPKQRATLILRVYQEMSHEDIARVLGSSVGACKANLFHALRRLRELLQP